MLVNEIRDIMDETGDENEWTGLGLLLEAFPADDRKIVAIIRPLKRILLLAELLELHGELTFADFVVGEDLEMAGET